MKRKCPKCKIGKNASYYGGTSSCFHCSNCPYDECSDIGLGARLSWWAIDFQEAHPNIPMWMNKVFWWIREKFV